MSTAQSNIFINMTNETRYFYLDDDASGEPPNGASAYTMVFLAGETPSVGGFFREALTCRIAAIQFSHDANTEKLQGVKPG